MSFLIAGGGIAGLAAALAAARAGREVRLFEQAEAFEEVGAGLQLGPNGVKALQMLGAWDHIEPLCFAPPAIHIRDGLTAATLARLPLDPFAARFGAPYRVAHRADLLAGLLKAAQSNPRIQLNLARRITGFTPGRLEFEAGAPEPFTALVGADGIRSAIRQSLLKDGPPVYAGQIIHRALVPRAQVSALEPEVTLWLCPGGHVVHYPVSGGRMMNLVAACDDPLGQTEGWHSTATPQEVAAHFPQACVDLRYALGVPSEWRKWAGASRPRAPRSGEGNVTLIGDAAHPMLPYLAQGAVMALEDAATLGAHLSREPDTAQAFRAYEAARLPRASRVAAMSGNLARIYHARGLVKHARDLALKLMPPAMQLSRMAPLYDWKPPA